MSLKTYINSVLSKDDRTVDPIFLKQTLNAIVDSIPSSKPEPIDLGVGVVIPAPSELEVGQTAENINMPVSQELLDKLYPGAVIRFDLYAEGENEGELILIQEAATAVITQGLQAYGANITVYNKHYCIDIWPPDDEPEDIPEELFSETIEDQQLIANIVSYICNDPGSCQEGENYNYYINFDPFGLEMESEPSYVGQALITAEYFYNNHYIVFRDSSGNRISLDEVAKNFGLNPPVIEVLEITEEE